jgi:hypothetical protein
MTTKKINIYLRDSVHTEAKVVGVLKKTTLALFLEQSIREAVDRDKSLLKELLKP